MDKYYALLDEFKNFVTTMDSKYPNIAVELSNMYKSKISNAFIYNLDLDNLDPNDIQYILVADNPGREEQIFNRYLIGKAGKAARRILEKNLQIYPSIKIF